VQSAVTPPISKISGTTELAARYALQIVCNLQN